jgi:hypothetical protein
MAKESTYGKVQRKITEMRTTKVRAEAQKESLLNERNRIMRDVSDRTNGDVLSEDQLEIYCIETKASISKDIDEMVEIIESEGFWD